MADPRFVDLVLGWFEAGWDETNYPGSYDGNVPAFVDADSGESQSYQGRQVTHPLDRNNSVTVSSSPQRTNTPIGTEFDYAFDDGVSIRVVGMHEDQYGHLSGADEFRALYQEARRVLHQERTWPDRNATGSQHTHTLSIADETNLSGNYTDLFEYDITVTFGGYEELP